MTPKQEQFCHEYLIDLNGTQAAIRAGYSAKRADAIASENLRKPVIAERISELIRERTEAVEITTDRILTGLARIAFADPRRSFDDDGQIDPKKIPGDLADAVAGIEPGQHGTKIKLADRLKALELLGRYKSLFTDRVEHTGVVGQVHIFLPDNGRDPELQKDVIDEPRGS